MLEIIKNNPFRLVQDNYYGLSGFGKLSEKMASAVMLITILAYLACIFSFLIQSDDEKVRNWLPGSTPLYLNTTGKVNSLYSIVQHNNGMEKW